MTRNNLLPQPGPPAQRAQLVQRGLWLEYATLAWNVVGRPSTTAPASDCPPEVNRA